jgi:hypothetical protein
MAITDNQPLVNEIDQAIQNWYFALAKLNSLKRLNKGGSTPEQKLIAQQVLDQTKVVPVEAGIVQGLTGKIIGALSKYPSGIKEWTGLLSTFINTTNQIKANEFIRRYRRWANTYLGTSTLLPSLT